MRLDGAGGYVQAHLEELVEMKEIVWVLRTDWDREKRLLQSSWRKQ